MSEKGIAIITGAGKGIGKSIAKGLALDGYQTILISRNEERLRLLAEDIGKTVSGKLKPEWMPLDITDHSQVREIITRLSSRYKSIAILVNNAGMWLDGTLDESVENFTRLLNVNLVSQFVLLKEVGLQMKKQNRGHIFNIASRAGKYGFPGSGLYSASKFGLIGLGESLFREFTEYGVKVTSICPGWVNTDMAQDARTPLENHEMIQPEDILKSIRYVLGLSESVSIREIMIECSKSVL